VLEVYAKDVILPNAGGDCLRRSGCWYGKLCTTA
jgi:hypothetical protein